MKKCVHILVSGHVQGVFFRACARDRALELGIRGIIRNLPDGRVEIVAQGSASLLERFVEWCWQGPDNAFVEDLQIEDWAAGCDFETFSISH